ncbi:CPBP family intramembrane glutamic endopeptidase [Oleiagrimonas soli]|uniref:CAAX prenyl protease 2/Lysostaphin resistance protein A-like domain-containing protein n=1 Tax=Oleiagrimonas soli TaxID=1543381 RepID=A0A099CY88_9GAMM|nr:type II CAAX endopeptidase family protein [Oleiagrimonas soli]KGI78537.1 hypothetical protein LF63_0103465 [Oleiagrimonas soli]MBB6184193.1 hypothetical protein [Oleiagrimonas soli]
MTHPVPAFVTPPEANAWARWLWYSPLARIVFFVLLFALFSTLAAALAGHVEWAFGPIRNGQSEPGFASLMLRTVPGLLAYLVLVRGVERRWPSELGTRRLFRHVLLGLGLGALVIGLSLGTLWLLGVYRATGIGGHVDWLNAFVFYALSAGVFEEIAFRGVLFRIVEEGLGTWAALLTSALAFGAAHLANPNATLWSALAIAVEAGLLFGLVYHLTRSLWATISLHASWNMLEGPVLGTSVSGLPAHGWVHTRMQGANLLTGGPFGPEASLVMMLVALAISVALIVLARRRGIWLAPSWTRRARGAPGTI